MIAGKAKLRYSILPVSIFAVIYLFFISVYNLYSYIDMYFVKLSTLLSIFIISSINNRSNITKNIFYSSFMIGLSCFEHYIFFCYAIIIAMKLFHLRKSKWRLWALILLGLASAYSYIYMFKFILKGYTLYNDYDNIGLNYYKNYIIIAIVIITILFIVKTFIYSKNNILVFICSAIVIISLFIQVRMDYNDSIFLLYLYPISIMISHTFKRI